MIELQLQAQICSSRLALAKHAADHDEKTHGNRGGSGLVDVHDIFSNETTKLSDDYNVSMVDVGGGWKKIGFENKKTGFTEQSLNIKIDSAGTMHLNNVYIPESLRGRGLLTNALKEIRKLPLVTGRIRVYVGVDVKGWNTIISRAGFRRETV